nr:sorbitol dehydrogenase-like [Ipomoea batatas]
MGKGANGVSFEPTENMAAWLLGVGNLKIQPFNLPPLGPHDVRVSMKAIGICGSDVHYLKLLRCSHCKEGSYNLLRREMKFFGNSAVSTGSLANQIVHPADLCFKLPENVSLEERRDVRAVERRRLRLGRRANIGPETKRSKNVCGSEPGPIGLVSMLSASRLGAPKSWLVWDVDDQALAFREERFGEDVIIKVYDTRWKGCG